MKLLKNPYIQFGLWTLFCIVGGFDNPEVSRREALTIWFFCPIVYIVFKSLKKNKKSKNQPLFEIDENKKRYQITDKPKTNSQEVSKFIDKKLSMKQNYNNAKTSMAMMFNDFNRILTDVQCGFKTLDPYLSRFRILLNLYSDMSEIDKTFQFNNLTISVENLHQVFDDELSNFIKN